MSPPAPSPRPATPWLWAAGVLVGVAALPAYLAASTQLALAGPSREPHAWTALLALVLGGVLVLTRQLLRAPSLAPLRAAFLSGAVAATGGVGAYGVYVYRASAMLAAAATSPRVGDPAPALAVTDPEGRRWTLAQLRGSTVLLVFYRGHW